MKKKACAKSTLSQDTKEIWRYRARFIANFFCTPLVPGTLYLLNVIIMALSKYFLRPLNRIMLFFCAHLLAGSVNSCWKIHCQSLIQTFYYHTPAVLVYASFSSSPCRTVLNLFYHFVIFRAWARKLFPWQPCWCTRLLPAGFVLKIQTPLPMTSIGSEVRFKI